MLGQLVALALGGLIVGALARFALPGRDPLPLWGTIALGIAGSFLGGLVVLALDAEPAPGSFFVAAVVTATALLYLYRRFVQKRPLTGPRAR
ncbi:MAG TPA: hypothetical protein VML35_01520 [Gaiellaceae bacterium]|nr:hypothetical protein [Gaiellaceae bacterium]